MLIDDEIREAVLDGRLFKKAPVRRWSSESRVFLMCPALRQAIEAGKTEAASSDWKSFAQLEVAISSYIEGNLITESLLKQLEPKKFEHWAVRSRRPKPSIRVFGRFVKPDWFVGTHLKLRRELGKKWADTWEQEKLVCEDHWRDAGLSKPFSAPPDFKYEAYITDNATAKLGIQP